MEEFHAVVDAVLSFVFLSTPFYNVMFSHHGPEEYVRMTTLFYYLILTLPNNSKYTRKYSLISFNFVEYML